MRPTYANDTRRELGNVYPDTWPHSPPAGIHIVQTEQLAKGQGNSLVFSPQVGLQDTKWGRSVRVGMQRQTGAQESLTIFEVRVAQSDLCFTEINLVAVETKIGVGRYWR